MSNGINIPITTSVNTAPLGQLQGSLASLRASLKQAKADFETAAPNTDLWQQSAAEVKRLEAEITGLESAAGKTAGSASNMGRAMLEGSRGIQDLAAAGLPGIVNNLEGLATALGLTAGAAGGITLVAVGLDLLVRNWDNIKSAFGEPEKVKAFWSAITPDEAAQKRLDAFNVALENQAKNLERIAEARRATLEAQRQEDELLAKKKELWKDIVPSPDQRGDLPPLPGLEPETPAMREARRKVEEAKANTQEKVGKFQSLDTAVLDQQKRLDAIEQVATFDERLGMANAPDLERLKKLRERIAKASQGGAVPRDLIEEANGIEKAIADRRAKMAAELPNVPGLTDGLTGDSEKDREVLSQRAAEARSQLGQLTNQRTSAARDAESAARGQAMAEQGAAGQQQLENEQRGANAFKAIGLPPAPGVFQGADAQGGLADAVRQLSESQRQQLQSAQTAVTEIARLQDGSAQMEQKLASALGAFTSTLQRVVASLNEVEGRVNNIEVNGRR